MTDARNEVDPAVPRAGLAAWSAWPAHRPVGGCTCVAARPAGTWAVATTRRASTRPPTTRPQGTRWCTASSRVKTGSTTTAQTSSSKDPPSPNPIVIHPTSPSPGRLAGAVPRGDWERHTQLTLAALYGARARRLLREAVNRLEDSLGAVRGGGDARLSGSARTARSGMRRRMRGRRAPGRSGRSPPRSRQRALGRARAVAAA